MLLALLLTSLEMVPQSTHTTYIQHASWHPSGKYFLTTSSNETKLWNSEGLLLRTFPGQASSTAWLSDDTFAIAGRGQVSVLRMNGDVVGKDYDCQGRLLARAANGNILASCANTHFKILTPQGKVLVNEAAGSVRGIAAASDGGIVTLTYTGSVQLRDANGALIKSIETGSDTLRGVSISRDDRSSLSSERPLA